MGTTPIPASLLMHAMTSSSVSPSPTIRLEKTWFLPKSWTDCESASQRASRESPGHISLKRLSVAVSTLNLTSATPREKRRSGVLSVG